MTTCTSRCPHGTTCDRPEAHAGHHEIHGGTAPGHPAHTICTWENR